MQELQVQANSAELETGAGWAVQGTEFAVLGVPSPSRRDAATGLFSAQDTKLL